MGRHVVSFLKVWREGQTHPTNLDERQKRKKGNEIYEILLRFVLFCFVLFGGGGVYSVVHTYNFNFTIIFLLQFFTGLKKGRGGKYLIIHCLISHVNSRKIFAATKIRGRGRPLMATLMLRAWWVLK